MRKYDLYLSLAIAEYADSVSLSLTTPVGDDSTYPRLARVINEIKERYTLSRRLLYESLEESESGSKADRITSYADLSDGAVYGTRPAKLKLAFESAFNVLDKIAFFLNEYLHIGMPEKDVNFITIWTFGGSALRADIKSQCSFQLFALHDISRELQKQAHLEPIKLKRHISTHRYLIPHVLSKDGWRVTLDSPHYHTGYKELFAEVVELLRVVRSAVLYLVAFVNEKEMPTAVQRRRLLTAHVPRYISKNLKPTDSPV